eukprot:1192133-Prorocentrum_minimum.AAC.2
MVTVGDGFLVLGGSFTDGLKGAVTLVGNSEPKGDLQCRPLPASCTLLPSPIGRFAGFFNPISRSTGIAYPCRLGPAPQFPPSRGKFSRSAGIMYPLSELYNLIRGL